MGDDATLPLIPFDPREVGPVEFVQIQRRRVTGFVDDNSRVLIAAATLLVIAGWYIGVEIPSVPGWLFVAFVVSLLFVPTGWMFGNSLTSGLYNPETVPLSVQNPNSGDQQIKRLSPEQWQSIRVVNHNGVEKERDYLKTVHINGIRFYEVDSYYEAENVAVASWQAGVSNSEIRRDRARIDYIKTEAEKEADKALELLANHPMILREHGSEVANRLIQTAEDIQVTGGGQLHEQLGKRLDEADPSDDLLGRREQDDDRDQEASGDEAATDEQLSIHERAKQNGKQNGSDTQIMESDD